MVLWGGEAYPPPPDLAHLVPPASFSEAQADHLLSSPFALPDDLREIWLTRWHDELRALELSVDRGIFSKPQALDQVRGWWESVLQNKGPTGKDPPLVASQRGLTSLSFNPHAVAWDLLPVFSRYYEAYGGEGELSAPTPDSPVVGPPGTTDVQK